MNHLKKICFLCILFVIFYNNCYSQILWEKIINTDSLLNIKKLKTDPNGILYAATYLGLFFSTNQGKTWNKINNEFSNETVNDILFFDSKNIFIGTAYKGIFKSTDNGITWIDCGVKNIWINELIKDSDGNIFAATEDCVYKSIDSGNTWIRCKNGFGYGVNEIWSIYSTFNGNILAGSECGLYLSEDKGNNWKFIESFTCGDITSIFGIDNDRIIFIGGADRFDGIYYSTNGGYNWIYINKSDTVEWTTSILSINDEIYFGCYLYGLFKYNIQNSSFTKIQSGSINHVYSMTLDSLGYLYILSNALYKSKNTLDSMKYLNNNVYSFSLEQNYPNPFSIKSESFSGGNTGTTIEYTLKSAGQINIIIYNLLGEKVFETGDQFKPKGKNKFVFNANNLPCGVYFYQLKSGDFTKVKKMILLR